MWSNNIYLFKFIRRASFLQYSTVVQRAFSTFFNFHFSLNIYILNTKMSLIFLSRRKTNIIVLKEIVKENGETVGNFAQWMFQVWIKFKSFWKCLYKRLRRNIFWRMCVYSLKTVIELNIILSLWITVDCERYVWLIRK